MFDMVTHHYSENAPCVNEFLPYVCDNALVNQTKCGADHDINSKMDFGSERL